MCLFVCVSCVLDFSARVQLFRSGWMKKLQWEHVTIRGEKKKQSSGWKWALKVQSFAGGVRFRPGAGELVSDLAFGCENWLEAVLGGVKCSLVNRGLWPGGGVGPTGGIQLVVGNGASVLVRSVGGEVLGSHTGGVLERRETHRK